MDRDTGLRFGKLANWNSDSQQKSPDIYCRGFYNSLKTITASQHQAIACILLLFQYSLMHVQF